MRIGLYGGNVRRGDGLASLVDDVARTEDDGFASYWFSQVGTYDALTLVALAGQSTKSIELGVGVVPTYPRHPSALAQQAATANALAGGRLTLGVGPSHRRLIEEGLGIAYESPAHHTREYVEVVKALATEGRVRYRGDHFQVDSGFSVPGAQPFAVVVSALAPLMLKTAGEVADGTVTWMVGRKTIDSHIVPRLTEAARNANREKPRIIVGLPVCVHDDRDEARARAVELFRGYTSLPSYRRQLDHEGLREAGEIAVVGTEVAVADQLQAYFAAGATDIIASIFPAGDSGRASFRRTRKLLASLATWG